MIIYHISIYIWNIVCISYIRKIVVAGMTMLNVCALVHLDTFDVIHKAKTKLNWFLFALDSNHTHTQIVRTTSTDTFGGPWSEPDIIILQNLSHFLLIYFWIFFLFFPIAKLQCIVTATNTEGSMIIYYSKKALNTIKFYKTEISTPAIPFDLILFCSKCTGSFVVTAAAAAVVASDRR